MAELIDAGLVEAYQRILDRRNAAIGGLGSSIGGLVSGVGGAAINRKQDANALAADLDAMRRTLANEQGTIAEREFALNPTGPGAVQSTYGPYEAAQREAELSDLGTRKSDVQTALGDLDAIGPVKFGNVYDVRAPKLPERKATDYSGRWKDIAAAQPKDDPLAGLEKDLAIIDARKRAQMEIDKNKPRPVKAAPVPKPTPQSYATTIQAADETLSGLDSFEQMVADPERVSRFTPQVKARADAMRGNVLEQAAGAINPMAGSKEDVEKASDMFALAESIYAPIRNKTFGAALSKGDLERAAQNQPTPGDTAPILQKKTQVLREITQKARDWWYNFAQKQGYNVGGLEPTATQPEQPIGRGMLEDFE